MRLVIQRVLEASVTVDGQLINEIGKGYMVLVGIGADDTKEEALRYLTKMSKLRIFEDENGKTNLSLNDVGGEVLMISQFTLYADCRKGNRPSFVYAGKPDMAEELYDWMLVEARKLMPVVKGGVFGGDMKVSLINDGPFTIVLDENTLPG
ncbi:MAG: D-tyrosyl-tRNA(Tyr) deacylase [Lachnospiraceae bacterium]|nr:D-tyrosyl-tRNA(Tyr) deacylase [Candidatus Equihabitans merdae]